MTDTDLMIVDLDHTAHRAIMDGIEAEHALRSLGPDVPDHAKRTAAWLVKLAQDNAALVAALTAALQVAIQDRDQLIDSQLAVQFDMISTIAENMNWTHDTVRQVLTLFLNSDEQLLADDVAYDSLELAEVREAFTRLDTDIEHVIETE